MLARFTYVGALALAAPSGPRGLGGLGLGLGGGHALDGPEDGGGGNNGLCWPAGRQVF